LLNVARLPLETFVQGLAINKHIASDHSHAYTLCQNV